MGLLENLFKPKPDTGAKKIVEGPGKTEPATPKESGESSEHLTAAAPKSSTFLAPKTYVPRASAQVVAPTRGHPPHERKPEAAPGAGSTAEKVIVLTLGDVLSRIPMHFLRQGVHDVKRELRFRMDDLSADIARGRAAVGLAEIVAQCPDVFVPAAEGFEDIQIRLPLQKLVEQIGVIPTHRPAPPGDKGGAQHPPPASARSGLVPSTESIRTQDFSARDPQTGPARVSLSHRMAPASEPAAGSKPSSLEGGEEKIHLSLAAILKRCPPEIVVGTLPTVDESVKITFPFPPIERQLASGKVEVSSLRFIAALPPGLMKCFDAKEGVKVPLALEEIFQNLPGLALQSALEGEGGAAVQPTRAFKAEQFEQTGASPVELKPADLAETSTAPPVPQFEPKTPESVPRGASGVISVTPAQPGPVLQPSPLVELRPVATAAMDSTPAAAAETMADRLGFTPEISPNVVEGLQTARANIVGATGAPTQVKSEEDVSKSSAAPARVSTKDVAFAELSPAVVSEQRSEEKKPEAISASVVPPLEQVGDKSKAEELKPEVFKAEQSKEKESKDEAKADAALNTVVPSPYLPAEPAPLRAFIPVLRPPILLRRDDVKAATDVTPAQSNGPNPAPEAAAPLPDPPDSISPPAEERSAATETAPPESHVAAAPEVPAVESSAPAAFQSPPEVVSSLDPVAAAPVPDPVPPPAIPLQPHEAASELVTNSDLVTTDPNPPGSIPRIGPQVIRPVVVVPPKIYITPVATSVRTEPVSPSPGKSAPPTEPVAATEQSPKTTSPSQEERTSTEKGDAPAVESSSSEAGAQSPSLVREPEIHVPVSPQTETAPPPGGEAVQPAEASLWAAPPELANETVSDDLPIETTAPPRFTPIAERPATAAPVRPAESATPPDFDQVFASLFVTEGIRDLPRVAQLLACLPGIRACVISSPQGMESGGELPTGFDRSLIREIGQQMQGTFATRTERLTAGPLQHLTLHGEHFSLTFFTSSEACVCAVHRARIFLPGVREKFAAVAEDLSGQDS